MNDGILLGDAESVCPECLARIPAQRVRRGNKVYLEKICPEHGEFRVLIWEGSPDFDVWHNHRAPSAPERCATGTDKGCPFDCGLCPEHRQQTCCVLLEVTARCDLACPVCFASAATTAPEDPSIERIEGWYRALAENGGGYNIQLSGGEPTVRDDIPEIIRRGKRYGFSFFQLNTNGLRLSDRNYVGRLKAAGLSCAFLQFDGTEDSIYQTIRGAKLLAAKEEAIRNCGEFHIGVILVPTIVPGINDRNIGDIIRFAMDRMPTVRGVHFQPISYFGRFPEAPPEERMTIPRMLREIEAQTASLMRVENFSPPGGEHARCSFHGNFILMEDGSLKPSTKSAALGCCDKSGSCADGMRKSRAFVSRQWASPLFGAGVASSRSLDSLDFFLRRAAEYTLAISGMLFQDAWTLDLDRLRDCHIHVMSQDGKLIPFCAYNLTSRSGHALYRPIP